MTPALFDLPLRAGDAAALASLVLEHAEGKPLNDDLRNRLASRAGALKLSSIQPYFGSLEKDPIHPSTYYLAVDGLESQPLLMHMAPAIAPSSGLFPKAILIGRMQAAGARRREIVVNATPFAATDSAPIRVFAEEVNRAFLPRPLGNRPAISVSGPWVESHVPAVFEEFRSIYKRKGANVASLLLSGEAERAMWAAIRTGWREGYALEKLPLSAETSETVDDLKDLAALAVQARQSRKLLSVDAGTGDDTELLDRIRRATNGRVECKLAPGGPGKVAEVFQRVMG